MGLFIFLGISTAIAACIGIWGLIQLYKERNVAH